VAENILRTIEHTAFLNYNDIRGNYRL